MKKIISLILCFLLMTVSVVPSASAVVENDEYFEDGSYLSVGYGAPEYWESTDGEEESDPHSILSLIKRIIDFIKAFFDRFFGESGEQESVIKSVSKTKYAAYYDSNGTLLWVVYLTADFTYDGKKAECTDARTRYEIKDADWKLLSAECDKADNTAAAIFTVKQYKLGVPLKEIERKLTLTCDEKGTVK